VPISSKFLFSYLIVHVYITQRTFAKEKFNLDKMQSLSEVLKTFKSAAILIHHSHQSSLGLERVVTYIKEHVISGLTHLACFTFITFINLFSSSYRMLEKSILPGYEAKFAEVKGAK